MTIATLKDQAALKQLIALENLVFKRQLSATHYDYMLEHGAPYWIIGYFQHSQLIAALVSNLIKPQAEIMTVMVDEKHRRQSYAKQLCAHWLESLKQANYDEFWLEVDENNNAALSLYTQLGFCQTGRRKDYYDHNGIQSDALLMSLMSN